jgi:hypothetical protein
MAKHTPPKTDVHPLVASVAKDAGAPPSDLAVLTGYFGKEEGGYVRLYKSHTFRSYYDIPKEAIIHTEATDPTNSNSPTRVWVNPDAKIDVVATVDASFLHGSITTSHLAGATAAAAVTRQQADTFVESCPQVSQMDPTRACC